MDFRQPRVLGRSGLQVSRLGIAASYGAPATSIEKAFHEFGINYFYWGSWRHAQMKKALRQLASQHRENMVIALQSYDHLGLLLSFTFERGRRALGIDYADVLILGMHQKPIHRRVIEAALELKQRGKIRHIAVSGHRRLFFRELLEQGLDKEFDVFMVRYNAANRGAETEIFPYLPRENRPGILSYTATRWRQLLDPKRMPQGERPLRASECYRFVLSNPDVDVCLVGPANEAQMEEALVAIEAGPLTSEEMTRAICIGDFVHGKKK